ncbi:endoplasmic reticulum oxidoreductin 1, partial [Meira miltonrushii]
MTKQDGLPPRHFARARIWIVFVLIFASIASCASSSFQNPLQNPLMPLNNDQAKQQGILASVLNHGDTLSSCKPTGQISDARCDYETVEMDINSANFFPILDKLRREKYFRLYKVDLYKDCPFWNDNSLCMSKDCTVSKMEEEEIPTEYRSSALSSVKTTNESDDEGDPNTCQCAESDFCHWEDEEWSPESSWVDLLDNPERFTGYAGSSARKVWTAIYEENCFGVARAVGASMTSSAGSPYDVRIKSARLGDPGSASAAAEALSSLLTGQSSPLDSSTSESEQCLEKRVFYKIISGLHASISIHICHDYLDQQSGEWKPNLSCFVERIAQHPDRLQNLYFTQTVLVRSLAKLAEPKQLAKLAPNLPASSSPTTVSLASLLLQAINAPPTFDEESMFDEGDPESEFLRREFRDRFRNVSRIMDCVGCDKCRLWGKLQINGVGTALKVLFDANELSPQRLLQRSELVALINTVHRVSESIRAVETFRTLYQ